MTRSGRALKVGLAVLVVMAIAACESSGAGPDKDSKLPNGEALTFDLFMGEKIDFLDYAVRELKAQCMTKSGYPQMKEAGNEIYKGASQMLLIVRQRFRGFENEAEARAKGFGEDQPAERRPLVSFDAAFDKQSSACDTQAHKAIGKDGRSVLDAYAELGNTMSGEFGVWTRTNIKAGLGSLVDCLEKGGFKLRDRDSFINKMWDVKLFDIQLGALDGEPYAWRPTEKAGTVQVGPPIPARKYVPSGQEADLAAAWYGCDKASGRVDKLLAGARGVQSEIVSKHEEKLAELNPQIEALAKKAAELVGRP